MWGIDSDIHGRRHGGRACDTKGCDLRDPLQCHLPELPQLHGPTVREHLKRKAEAGKGAPSLRVSNDIRLQKKCKGVNTIRAEVNIKEKAIDTLRERFSVRFRDGKEGMNAQFMFRDVHGVGPI